MEVELYWHDLETDLPQGDDCVILFPQISDVGILYTASNSEFARQNALKHGYTHWFPIPKHSRELEMREIIKIVYEDEPIK